MWLIFTFLPFMVNAIDPVLKDLLTPMSELGESCGYDSCPEIKEGWTNVHIVPHSHAELGYMKTFDDYYTGFHRMVYELIRQGRLVFVGGGWGMVDEATTYYQAVIDSYTFSLRKLNSTFLSCARPLVAWQADSFGHSREHASLIAQMGFDALFINPISFDDEMIRMERKALEFLWRGSDDLGPETDIYTHKLFDGYWSPPGFCFGSLCSDPLLITSDSVFKNAEERANVFIDAIRYRQAPYYNTRQVMVVLGQRMGYFNARIWYENIDKLIFYVNERTYRENLKINLMYSNPSCYLNAVQGENPILETKQDDFFPFAYNKYSYASGMFTSRPIFKYFVREANIYLQIAKQLQVLANLKNKEEVLEELKWIVGVVQDHNIITGAMRPYAASYYSEKLHSAIEQAIPLIGESFNKLRKTESPAVYHRCSFNTSSCQHTKGNAFNIVVYNPLAWSVNTSIRLPIFNKDYDVFDSTDTKIRAVIMKTSDHVLKIPNRHTTEYELVYIAKVPPLGFTSYKVIAKRRKRSFIKKTNENQQKTNFIRQVNNNRSIFDDYDDFDETTAENKIDFGNVSRDDVINDNSNVVTSRSKTTATALYSTTEVEVTSVQDTTAVENLNNSKVNFNWFVEEAEEKESVGEKQTNHKYYYEESNDTFIRNEYIQINLDEYRKISTMNLSNGINTTLDIQYYYYISDVPEKNSTKIDPGAYIFRSNDSNPVPIIDYINTRIYKSDVVEEIHCKYSDFASFVVKLYSESPVLEVDWVLGPVPADDGLGKEVFLRYTTNLNNDGVFYTDANGRQMIKRIQNTRATYEPHNLDPIAGNMYPVTSRIYMEDLNKNLRFSIFNDRSQGGASILEGSIDLFVLRRIFTDDSKVQSYMNETEYGKGLIVRGTHYLYLTKANFKQNRLFEKKISKEIELKSQIFVSLNNDKAGNKTFTGLKSKLPFGVHLLSLEKTDDGLLVRLENYLEKVDVLRKNIKRVYLKDLFFNIQIINAVETTLGGHILKKDWTPIKWQKNESFVRNFNDFYGKDKKEFSDDVNIYDDDGCGSLDI
ncbi:unnamed protein product, partial [Brenthis ino]